MKARRSTVEIGLLLEARGNPGTVGEARCTPRRRRTIGGHLRDPRAKGAAKKRSNRLPPGNEAGQERTQVPRCDSTKPPKPSIWSPPGLFFELAAIPSPQMGSARVAVVSRATSSRLAKHLALGPRAKQNRPRAKNRCINAGRDRSPHSIQDTKSPPAKSPPTKAAPGGGIAPFEAKNPEDWTIQRFGDLRKSLGGLTRAKLHAPPWALRPKERLGAKASPSPFYPSRNKAAAPPCMRYLDTKSAESTTPHPV